MYSIVVVPGTWSCYCYQRDRKCNAGLSAWRSVASESRRQGLTALRRDRFELYTSSCVPHPGKLTSNKMHRGRDVEQWPSIDVTSLLASTTVRRTTQSPNTAGRRNRQRELLQQASVDDAARAFEPSPAPIRPLRGRRFNAPP